MLNTRILFVTKPNNGWARTRNTFLPGTARLSTPLIPCSKRDSSAVATPKRSRKPKEAQVGDLGLLIPESMRKLLSANGIETVRQLGVESVRSVILDILSGKNLRSVTESLTRRRIAALNLALVSLFLKGATELDQFVDKLPDMAAQAYANKSYTAAERALAQWILGLTNKAYQNVLRSDLSLVPEYKDVYVEACREVVARHAQEHGELVGTFTWDKNSSVASTPIDWTFLVYLLNAVVAQTLTTRGSDKSTYGKLFERLVLGSLLYILDFEPSLPPQRFPGPLPDRVFWLSLRKDEDREADATLIYGPGLGVRFDIGFIGIGNTEITKDKTTRFRRNAKIAAKDYYMATIIIVDRVG